MDLIECLFRLILGLKLQGQRTGRLSNSLHFPFDWRLLRFVFRRMVRTATRPGKCLEPARILLTRAREGGNPAVP
jgi:hypothetical protein